MSICNNKYPKKPVILYEQVGAVPIYRVALLTLILFQNLMITVKQAKLLLYSHYA